MNNRYICKAKRKDNNEWVEGVAIFADNKAFILNNAKVEFIKGFNENRLNFVLVEVIPETVRQCTTLTDKNGKWIFEGDVVRTKYYGKIIGNRNVADYDTFKIVYVCGMHKVENKNRSFILVSGEQYEVIGNIHDNPDLLEVER